MNSDFNVDTFFQIIKEDFVIEVFRLKTIVPWNEKYSYRVTESEVDFLSMDIFQVKEQGEYVPEFVDDLNNKGAFLVFSVRMYRRGRAFVEFNKNAVLHSVEEYAKLWSELEEVRKLYFENIDK